MDQFYLIERDYGKYMCKLFERMFKDELNAGYDMYEVLSRYFAPSEFLYEDLIMNDCLKRFILLMKAPYGDSDLILNEIRELGYDNFKDLLNNIDIPNYRKDPTGKYRRYNFITNEYVYYCDNSTEYISHITGFPNRFDQFDEDECLVFESFALEIKRKALRDSGCSYVTTSFGKSIGEIKDIRIVHHDDKTKTIIINDNIIIDLDRYNRITGYTNPVVEVIYGDFLSENKTIKKLDLENVTNIQGGFLWYNNSLVELHIPKCEEMGFYCLPENTVLKVLDAPSLLDVGSKSFLKHDKFKVLPDEISYDRRKK